MLENRSASFYKDQGILSWILTRDHKRIGLLYMIFVFGFFFSGAILGFIMRLEMLSPGTLMKPQTYNSLFTLHGIIMIFLVVIPAIPTVFGNFFLPIQIGARDVVFPRINLLSWWLYIAGAALVAASRSSPAAVPLTPGGRSMRLTACGQRSMSLWPSLGSLSSDSPLF